MGLPKHTCISCAYLHEFGGKLISHTHREWALNDKRWNSGGINYQQLICHKGQQNFAELDKDNKVLDIRNGIIKSNKCKQWIEFTGISPIAVEQRKSSGWAKWAFWVALASLIAILATWVLTQFVFD